MSEIFAYAETELDRYVDGKLKRPSWREESARYSTFDLQALLDIFTSSGADQRKVLPDKDRYRDRYHQARALASTCREQRNRHAHALIGRKFTVDEVFEVASDFGRLLRALGWEASAQPLNQICNELNRLRFTRDDDSAAAKRLAAAENERAAAHQQRIEALAVADVRRAENTELAAEIVRLRSTREEADTVASAALVSRIEQKEVELRAAKDAQLAAQQRADDAAAALQAAETQREVAIREADERAREVDRLHEQSERAQRQAAEQIMHLKAERDTLRETAERTDDAEARAAADHEQDVVVDAIATLTDRLAALEHAMAKDAEATTGMQPPMANAPAPSMAQPPRQRLSPVPARTPTPHGADPLQPSTDLRSVLDDLEEQLRRRVGPPTAERRGALHDPSTLPATPSGTLPEPGEKWPYEAGPFSYSLQPSVTDVKEHDTGRYLSQVIGKTKAQAVARRLLRHRPEGGTIRVDTDGDVSTQRKSGGGRYYLGRVKADEWFEDVVQRVVPAGPAARAESPRPVTPQPGALPNPGEKWPYEAGPFSYSLQPSVTDVKEYDTGRYLSQVIGKTKAQAVARRLLRHRPEGGTIRVDTDGDVSTQRKSGGGRYYLGRVKADEWFEGVVED